MKIFLIILPLVIGISALSIWQIYIGRIIKKLHPKVYGSYFKFTARRSYRTVNWQKIVQAANETGDLKIIRQAKTGRICNYLFLFFTIIYAIYIFTRLHL